MEPITLKVRIPGGCALAEYLTRIPVGSSRSGRFRELAARGLEWEQATAQSDAQFEKLSHLVENRFSEIMAYLSAHSVIAAGARRGDIEPDNGGGGVNAGEGLELDDEALFQFGP